MSARINDTPGAYRQDDLERLDPEELRAIRDMAIARFNRDLDGPDAEYFELLAGAASDLLLARHEGVADAS